MPNVSVPDTAKLLLLDTCGAEASVAIAEGRDVLEQMLFPGRRASEALVSITSEILRRRSWTLRELDALVVVRGPGSFTGVRVGLSAAKALAEGSGRPLIALSRLEVLARKSGRASIVTLEAGRGEVFWAQATVDGVTEQAVAPLAWVLQHAQSLHLPVVREVADETKGGVAEVAALTAVDALPLALDRLSLHQTEDALLLDGLYLHKTEQETLARQRSHQIAAAMKNVFS